MPAISFLDLIPALPELFLVFGGLVLLLMAALKKDSSPSSLHWFILSLFAVGLLLALNGPNERVVTFNGLFMADEFSKYMKTLILLSVLGILVVSAPSLKLAQLDRLEYPLLILFATLGMLIMVSANDFLSLYMSIELQSLSIYVLTCFNRSSTRGAEAAVKYFVLGALSTGIMLYGIMLVYGYTGTTSFDVLKNIYRYSAHHIPLPVVVGLVFILVSLGFKLSAVPFHMWTPDVYEGTPTPVTAFIASAPKVSVFAVLLKLLSGPFTYFAMYWQTVLVIISILSMVLGAIAAIRQSDIKRLLAYGTIGNIGYALLA